VESKVQVERYDEAGDVAIPPMLPDGSGTLNLQNFSNQSHSTTMVYKLYQTGFVVQIRLVGKKFPLSTCMVIGRSRFDIAKEPLETTPPHSLI
jgi:hypothetical protein